jgi:hypothetical protein
MSLPECDSPCKCVRRRLPNKRPSETVSFERDNLHYCMTVGRFADGSIGEIFLNAAPHNSLLDVLASDSAILASLALQHGCPLKVITHALRRDSRGKAASPIGEALDRITL